MPILFKPKRRYDMSNFSKEELRKLAHIKPRLGDDVDNVIAKMIRRADTYGIRVTCVFNDIQFTVEPWMTHEAAYQLWRAEVDRQDNTRSKSMKAEVSRRESKALEERDVVRGQNVRVMLEHEKIQVPWHKRSAFNKVVRVNSSDGYSTAAVNFAIAWAVAMQQAMRKGKKVADVAKDLSHEVDFEGITGFMYGWAVSFLAKFWKHGEELRRWHNLDTQLGDEGKRANKKKGVTLNPAVLSIGKK
jgi:hypothetical protein